MEMYEIEGNIPLRGVVRISGSKNATLPLLTAALLGSSPSIIRDVPDLQDVRQMVNMLRYLGADVTYENNVMTIDPKGFKSIAVPYELMSKMRASFYAMGPLLTRMGKAKVSLPGGCAIGDRPVDLHLFGFEKLGAKLSHHKGYVNAKANKGGLVGADFSLMGACGTSVGATCNVLMAAVLAEGTTIIRDAAREPEVVELAQFLLAMGANIEGYGTNTIKVEGVKRLEGINWQVSFDRIEAATFAVAALVTNGDVMMENVRQAELESTLDVLENWGAKLDWLDEETLRVRRGSMAGVPQHIVTRPFPDFPTDAQSQFAVLFALTPGVSTIKETIYPDRFKYASELARLGASMKVTEKGTLTVNGVAQLEGAAMRATDLRAGAALVVAGLAAKGLTQVREIEHVERGYERFESKLRALGAKIARVAETAEDPGLLEPVFPDSMRIPFVVEA